jgi:hypothetical protein
MRPHSDSTSPAEITEQSDPNKVIKLVNCNLICGHPVCERYTDSYET